MKTVMVCLCSFLFVGLASAQPQPPDQPAGQQMGKGPCKAEIDQFCKDVEKGEVGECLKQHKDELSDACKATREKAPKTKPAKTEEKSPEQK